ncbi:hypothetical protein WJX82_010422 [Trebouxia sp. C0006]
MQAAIWGCMCSAGHNKFVLGTGTRSADLDVRTGSSCPTITELCPDASVASKNSIRCATCFSPSLPRRWLV